MEQGRMAIRDISIDLLEAHPENSNFMDAATLSKLRRHIERTGRYEPLTVRPHPSVEGRFQIINGHHRWRVLRALNYQTVQCVVWNLDDDQARLYLATLNRLSGTDIPERRAALLENLLASFTVDDLSVLLPDDRKHLEELEKLSHLELNEEGQGKVTEENFQVPVILSFILEESEAKEVNLALDLILNTEQEASSRGKALVRLAHLHLGRHECLSNE